MKNLEIVKMTLTVRGYLCLGETENRILTFRDEKAKIADIYLDFAARG